VPFAHRDLLRASDLRAALYQATLELTLLRFRPARCGMIGFPLLDQGGLAMTVRITRLEHDAEALRQHAAHVSQRLLHGDFWH
jgi:hypothetical protein